MSQSYLWLGGTGQTSDMTPHDLGPNDLVWDHFSRPRVDDVVARIRAAADAGFAAIGLYLGTFRAMKDDPAEVERVDGALAETGLVVANVEVASGWASPDRADASSTEPETLAYEMADHWGCRYLQVIGDYTGTIAEAAVGFGALCDRAADHGLLVGIEWVPSMTNIETAATAAAIALDNGQSPQSLLVFSAGFVIVKPIASHGAGFGDRLGGVGHVETARAATVKDGAGLTHPQILEFSGGGAGGLAREDARPLPRVSGRCVGQLVG